MSLLTETQMAELRQALHEAGSNPEAIQRVFDRQTEMVETATRERWEALTPKEQEEARAEHRRNHRPKRDWVGDR